VLSWPPARARRACIELAQVAEIVSMVIGDPGTARNGHEARRVEICGQCNPGEDGARALALARAIVAGQYPDGRSCCAEQMHDSSAPYAAAGMAAWLAGLMTAEHGPRAHARIIELQLFLTKGIPPSA
jgi:hypothetical protein